MMSIILVLHHSIGDEMQLHRDNDGIKLKIDDADVPQLQPLKMDASKENVNDQVTFDSVGY